MAIENFSMFKKTTFGEQEDIPKDGDGVAENAATFIEAIKSAPRRKEKHSEANNDPSSTGTDSGRHGRHRGERRRI